MTYVVVVCHDNLFKFNRDIAHKIRLWQEGNKSCSMSLSLADILLNKLIIPPKIKTIGDSPNCIIYPIIVITFIIIISA